MKARFLSFPHFPIATSNQSSWNIDAGRYVPHSVIGHSLMRATPLQQKITNDATHIHFESLVINFASGDTNPRVNDKRGDIFSLLCCPLRPPWRKLSEFLGSITSFRGAGGEKRREGSDGSAREHRVRSHQRGHHPAV